MTPDKVQTIMSKVEYASTWYGMYEEKVRTNKGNWRLSKEVYERTLEEIKELLIA